MGSGMGTSHSQDNNCAKSVINLVLLPILGVCGFLSYMRGQY